MKRTPFRLTIQALASILLGAAVAGWAGPGHAQGAGDSSPLAQFGATPAPASTGAALSVPRLFPAESRVAVVAFDSATSLVSGQARWMLSPGVVVRDGRNIMVSPLSVQGRDYVVRYTLDNLGLIRSLWLLNNAEISSLRATLDNDNLPWLSP